MNTKPLPIGIQTFRKIIDGNYLYADKTEQIYEMIRYPYGVYFLSRPRRFGKSLLISTLDEIFQGNRNLFKGLWLYDSAYSWQKYPIIRFDFSRNPVKNAAELERSIQRTLERLADKYQVNLGEGNYVEQFDDLIFNLAAENKVVILIDEYDKPILDNIENIEEAKHIQETLKRFYTVIKGMDEYVRFVLLTGISRFSKVGVFSGLNHLNDLTMDNQYAAMLGITQGEIENYFHDQLQLFSEGREETAASLQEKMKHWYNGFCFSRHCQPVYNPFSLLLLFQKREFQNYWFESGSPAFLIKLIKSRNYNPEQLDQLNVSQLAFSTYDIENLEIIPLLFQTGYLTIKGYNPDNRRYHLSYPNFEVESAFLTHLLGAFGEIEKTTAVSYLDQLIVALQTAVWSQFFHVFNSFLATINYELHIKQEKYYQTIFYLIFKLIGVEIGAEVHTNQGRIDAVIEMETAVYIFEFKLNGSAKAALQQIKTKSYFTRYQATGKTVHLIGANFKMDDREVAEWMAEIMRID